MDSTSFGHFVRFALAMTSGYSIYRRYAYQSDYNRRNDDRLMCSFGRVSMSTVEQHELRIADTFFAPAMNELMMLPTRETAPNPSCTDGTQIEDDGHHLYTIIRIDLQSPYLQGQQGMTMELIMINW